MHNNREYSKQVDMKNIYKELLDIKSQTDERIKSMHDIELSGYVYSHYKGDNYSIIQIVDDYDDRNRVKVFCIHSADNFKIVNNLQITDKIEIKGYAKFYDGKIQVTARSINKKNIEPLASDYTRKQTEKVEKNLNKKTDYEKNNLIENLVINKICLIQPKRYSKDEKDEKDEKQKAKGVKDFISRLQSSGYYDKIKIKERETIFLPEEIKRIIEYANKEKDTDLICIVRGGGINNDLIMMNDYLITEAISKSDIPVFLGIGHSDDDFICSKYAVLNAITPTQLANEIIEIKRREDNNSREQLQAKVNDLQKENDKFKNRGLWDKLLDLLGMWKV